MHIRPWTLVAPFLALASLIACSANGGDTSTAPTAAPAAEAAPVEAPASAAAQAAPSPAPPEEEAAEEAPALTGRPLPTLYPVRVYRRRSASALVAPEVARPLSSTPRQYADYGELRSHRWLLNLPARREAQRLPRWTIAMLPQEPGEETKLDNSEARSGADMRRLEPFEFPKPTPPPNVPFWILGEGPPCRMEPDQLTRVRYASPDVGFFDGITLRGDCPGLDGLQLAVQQPEAPTLRLVGPRLVGEAARAEELTQALQLPACEAPRRCRLYQRVEQVTLPTGHGLLTYAAEQIPLTARGAERCEDEATRVAGVRWLRPGAAPLAIPYAQLYPFDPYPPESYLLGDDAGPLALLTVNTTQDAITLMPIDPEQGPLSKAPLQTIPWDRFEGQLEPTGGPPCEE